MQPVSVAAAATINTIGIMGAIPPFVSTISVSAVMTIKVYRPQVGTVNTTSFPMKKPPF